MKKQLLHPKSRKNSGKKKFCKTFPSKNKKIGKKVCCAAATKLPAAPLRRRPIASGARHPSPPQLAELGLGNLPLPPLAELGPREPAAPREGRSLPPPLGAEVLGVWCGEGKSRGERERGTERESWCGEEEINHMRVGSTTWFGRS